MTQNSTFLIVSVIRGVTHPVAVVTRQAALPPALRAARLLYGNVEARDTEASEIPRGTAEITSEADAEIVTAVFGQDDPEGAGIVTRPVQTFRASVRGLLPYSVQGLRVGVWENVDDALTALR